MVTGCRLTEVLTLRWDDVDRKAGELRLPDSKDTDDGALRASGRRFGAGIGGPGGREHRRGSVGWRIGADASPELSGGRERRLARGAGSTDVPGGGTAVSRLALRCGRYQPEAVGILAEYRACGPRHSFHAHLALPVEVWSDTHTSPLEGLGAAERDGFWSCGTARECPGMHRLGTAASSPFSVSTRCGTSTILIGRH